MAGPVLEQEGLQVMQQRWGPRVGGAIDPSLQSAHFFLKQPVGQVLSSWSTHELNITS